MVFRLVSTTRTWCRARGWRRWCRWRSGVAWAGWSPIGWP